MKSMCHDARRNSPSVTDSQPDLLLHPHDVADRGVLGGAQLVGVEPAGGVRPRGPRAARAGAAGCRRGRRGTAGWYVSTLETPDPLVCGMRTLDHYAHRLRHHRLPGHAVAELVHDGDTVALEGFTHLIPFAAGHEIIRQRRRDLTLVRMTPDIVYDQLIGVGCARKLVFSWGGNPGVGSLHRFRDAVENGWPTPLEIEEHSHAGHGRTATSPARPGLPFAVLRGYIGTDLPAHTRHDQADHLPVHRRGADRGAGAATRRRDRPRAARRPRRATSSCGASPACRRRRCSAAKRSLVTVEEIVDELEPRPGAVVLPALGRRRASPRRRAARSRPTRTDYYERDNDFYRAWDAIAATATTFDGAGWRSTC